MRRFSNVRHHCENCQEDFICKEMSGDSEYINTLIKRLKFAGLIAKAVYYCDDCAQKYKKQNVEIWVKPVDSKKWAVSVPKGSGRFGIHSGPKCVKDDEYIIVENILTYVLNGESATKNGASNYELVFEKDVLSYDNDIVKFKVDAAVYKVLGIDFEYDMEEIKKGIKAWLRCYNDDFRKHAEYEQLILKKLDVSENKSIKYSKFEKFMRNLSL